MTHTIHQLEAFEFEVRRAIDHYAGEAPHMLESFFSEIDAIIARIGRILTAPRLIRGSTRAMHLWASFPHSVLYVVHEQLQVVDLTMFLLDRQDRHGFLPRFQ